MKAITPDASLLSIYPPTTRQKESNQPVKPQKLPESVKNDTYRISYLMRKIFLKSASQKETSDASSPESIPLGQNYYYNVKESLNFLWVMILT